MLLVVAHPQDTGASALADGLRDAGAPCALVHALDELDWELRLDADATPRSSLRHLASGEAVTGVVHRGAWAGEDEFAAAERTASWWALLAAFDGPAVGRPTPHGLLGSLDRGRIAGRARVWGGRWVLRTAWSSPSPVLARPEPGTLVTSLAPAGVVTDLTPCTPGAVVRVVVAGQRVVVPDDAALAAPAFEAEVRGLLDGELPALTSLVLDVGDGVRVLDEMPVPAAWLTGPVGALVADALREVLT